MNNLSLWPWQLCISWLFRTKKLNDQQTYFSVGQCAGLTQVDCFSIDVMGCSAEKDFTRHLKISHFYEVEHLGRFDQVFPRQWTALDKRSWEHENNHSRCTEQQWLSAGRTLERGVICAQNPVTSLFVWSPCYNIEFLMWKASKLCSSFALFST